MNPAEVETQLVIETRNAAEGADPRRPLRQRQIRVVVAALIGLATGLVGLFVGTTSLFVKPISADFGWSRATTSAATAAALLGLAFGAPVQGFVIDRFGPPRVILAATIALATAVACLSALPSSATAFSLTCLLIGALGAATSPTGYLSLVSGWFDRRLGLALACAMAGVGLGPAIFAHLIESVIVADGWRVAYQAMAAIMLAGGILALTIGKVGVRDYGTGIAPRDTGRDADTPFRVAIRDRRMLLLIVAIALGCASGLGMTYHVAAMLDDRGLDHGAVIIVVAANGMGLIFGRLVGGPLLDALPIRYVGAGAYLLGAAATPLLALDITRSFPVLAGAGFMLGLALGTEGDLAAFAIRRYFGAKAFAALYGCLFMAYSLGSVAGVILCGRLFDVSGNYALAGYAALTGFLIAAALMSLLSKAGARSPMKTAVSKS
ncbi:MFS transporter [Sphingomonas profundi]|uniref:MFS transporter n=1 Tax=Alterirhizorhabdus profundi TaxID=2681549 RepID=UPI001E53477A|nr:MFS transporter [Sphingomonas profundi]